jgi:hypothetical protein
MQYIPWSFSLFIENVVLIVIMIGSIGGMQMVSKSMPLKKISRGFALNSINVITENINPARAIRQRSVMKRMESE